MTFHPVLNEAQLALEPSGRIFCNRSVNMQTIKAIGFDMDYTLAIYKPETFETLAYGETIKKLITKGYPIEMEHWRLDWDYMIRGLTIDKIRGNVLKLDRHKYVKVAYHGFQEYTPLQRKSLYMGLDRNTYDEPDYSTIDTHFMVTEAYLYSQLIEFKDDYPEKISKTYEEIFYDVRWAVNLCHDDGSLKHSVAADPGRYIVPDPDLFETLHSLKRSGRKVFLVTNSHWAYAKIVMEHLFQNSRHRTSLTHWLDCFDCVITYANKPEFFKIKSSLIPIQEKVYEGGYYGDLHKILAINHGAEVLYVGDHIYGDILRSKKELGWRTMLIISELDRQITTSQKNYTDIRTYQELMHLKNFIDSELQLCLWGLNNPEDGNGTEPLLSPDFLPQRIQMLQEQKNRIRETLAQQLKDHHQRFHPVWGELMKTGNQNSRFADQIQAYACLYTSHVNNLRHYLLNKTFLSDRDFMPHDMY